MPLPIYLYVFDILVEFNKGGNRMKMHRIAISMIVLGLAAGLIVALCPPAHATVPNTTPAPRLSAGPAGIHTGEGLLLAQKDDEAKKDKAGDKKSKKEKIAFQPFAFPVAADQAILVKEFDIDKAEFRGDKSQKEDAVQRLKNSIPSELGGALLGELKAAGFTADFYSKEAAAKTPDALVVEGVITLVNQGSGATRVWIGMGAGSARIDATIKITKAQDPATALTEFELKPSSGGKMGVLAGGSQISGCIDQLAKKIAKRFEITAHKE